jgi:hypothetical protein
MSTTTSGVIYGQKQYEYGYTSTSTDLFSLDLLTPPSYHHTSKKIRKRFSVRIFK